MPTKPSLWTAWTPAKSTSYHTQAHLTWEREKAVSIDIVCYVTINPLCLMLPLPLWWWWRSFCVTKSVIDCHLCHALQPRPPENRGRLVILDRSMRSRQFAWTKFVPIQLESSYSYRNGTDTLGTLSPYNHTKRAVGTLAYSMPQHRAN
eukprot:scaffold45290_cov214-Amphora_coffeaeformis.AAC.2